MIYYKEGSAGGLFNRFMAENHLEDTAAFIQGQTPQCASEWELPPAMGILASIRLAKSRHLFVSGDTFYFCCTFDCNYVSEPEQDIDDAYGIALDISGKILFHPPGTKKYELSFKDIHVNYQYPHEERNYSPHFPGVRVNQMLYPAFGHNEEQRHMLLETEAARFLSQYWPEVLKDVSPIPLRSIAEDKMGLQIYTGYKLPECTDTLGLTVFRAQRISVTDEETGERNERRFPRGSILINSDTLWNRGLGSFNFTLAHELYHWFAHRVHMAFMDIVGRSENYATVKGHLESQADGVGARILMPREAVIKKYEEVLEKFSGNDGVDADAYELAVTECAAFFGASKPAMKKRLHELGLHEETRRPTVRRRLDIVEMFELYAADKGFRTLLDSGAYRYIKGFVVLNDPKYIIEDSFTPYAREHLTECTMTFREQYRRDDDTSGSLLHRKDAYFSRTADYDIRMKENPELLKKLAEKLTKLKAAYVNNLDEEETFCEYMMPIITDINTKYMGLDIMDDADDGLKEGKLILKPDKRIRNRYFEQYDFQTGKTIRITEPEVFQDKTLVHYKKFEEIRRNAWNNIELDMVMAVCAGYHLDMDMTEKAMLRAGYLLLQRNPTHLVYRFLVSHCRDLYSDTGTFNTLLILLGEKEIGTNKREKKR